MARQCTQPKRLRNAAWYKDKAMLAEAQEAGQILDEEQLAFLADPGVPDGQAVHTIIQNNAAFQTEDLDTYDSDCDDILNAKADLMANIFNYGSDVISEVPHSETYLNDMENQSVHATQDFEQIPAVDFTDNEIHKFKKNNDLKAQLQDKDSTICKLKDIIKSLREKSKEENVNYDYCEIETKNVELKNSVVKLLSENERLCNEINHVKQVFKEQFDSIKKTRIHSKEQRKEIVNIAAQIPSANTIVPGIFKLDLEPLAPRLLQNMEMHIEYIKYTQEEVDILRGIVEQAKAKQPLDKELDFSFRFGNDHIARIIGYGDYQLGNVTISRVYYVEGLGYNLFSVVQFCDEDLEVAFWKNTRFIRNLEGVDLLSGSRDINLYTILLDDMLKTSLIYLLSKSSKTKSWLWHRRLSHLNFDNGTEFVNKTLCEFHENVGRTPQQNDVVKRRNQILVDDAHTMLIFSKALLFLWAEAIDTTCYTQNRSIIRRRYNKTPYEPMQDKKPDLSFFHVFGALCYPTNDNDDFGNLDAKADIGPGLHSMTPLTSSSGLVPNTIYQQPCIPPNRDDCDHLFQPMFDEYFTPPSIAIYLVQEAVALRAVVLAESPMSTSIDQDAPSLSTPSTQEQVQSPNISQGFEESPKIPIFHDVTLNESLHEESAPQGSSSNMRQNYTPFEHLGKCNKDHPIANVIDDPSCSVSMRKQL
ncbi:integrase, catalytic region, zinc finger, CCHC-type containing protein [Tanacetum coccineum]|uniref:Integrase, catalytic region, zinc finger, CCHC-type containing protein n=1 Tax=Tanacetum coccineum TaxID=301880 RepID=A0ABQ5G9C0_9ASTR